MRLKKTEVFYENKQQKLFQAHDIDFKKHCKTLHPISMENLSNDSKRISYNYNNLKENMYSIIEKYKNSNGNYEFPNIEIPVAFHVIYPPGKENDIEFNISDEIINKQLTVLNGINDEDPGFSMSLPGYKTSGYTKSGFHFYNYHPENKAYSRTENYQWFYKTESFEATIKDELCIEPEHVINVFYANAQGYLGWSYFPDDFLEDDKMHGIVINYQAILGGKLNPYNYGKTLLHEMGHYFGLYHTFQGGCNGEDGCNDTPSQNNGNNIFNCGEINSCPDKEGNDPYNNYMNYVDDNCMTRFTDEQIFRMWVYLETFKPTFLKKNIVPPDYSIYQVSLFKGWNLFFIPEYDEQNLYLKDVKQYLESEIFIYDNGYKITSEFINGNNYWIKINNDINLNFKCNKTKNLTNANPWIIINNFLTYNLENNKNYYEFNNKTKKYITSQTMENNKSYWIKT